MEDGAAEAASSVTLKSLGSYWASQVAPVVKNLPTKAGDARDEGSIPGLGRSPGGGNEIPSNILPWRIP